MAALQATATLAGNGAVNATPRMTMQVSAESDGSSAVFARFAVQVQVSATLAGVSALSATATMSLVASATLAGSSSFVDIPLSPVNVGAGDTIFYIFNYLDAGAASRDTAISSLPGGEVLIYFIPISTVVPMSGYQVVVSQLAPVNNTLLANPNLLFAYDATQLASNKPSIIAHPGLTRAQLAQVAMILSNFGSLVLSGVT